MRHRAALTGAALAGVCALIAGPSPADTVGIPSLIDAGCCSTSNGSKLQNDPAGTEIEAIAIPQTSNGEPIPSLDDRRSESGDPATVNDVANGGSEAAGDLPGPDAVAVNESVGFDENSPDAVSSVAAPELSALTRLLMVFADLRATLFGGP